MVLGEITTQFGEGTQHTLAVLISPVGGSADNSFSAVRCLHFDEERKIV
jgi:hypothetical protein